MALDTAAGAITLEASGVRVTFGGVTALSDIELTLVGPGIVGVVGPNGSGKSTLMGVLSGLVRPDTGRVRMNAEDLSGKSVLKFAQRGLRRSFQATHLIPTLTLRDNLLVGIQRLDDDVRDRAQRLAESFGFADQLGSFPKAVPAGIQRLVQVASVVLTRPSVVLLDEPAAGLTDAECTHLAEIVRECARDSLVVLVEHNMQLMYELAQRVVVLINGAVAVDGTVQEVRGDPKFREAYLGLEAAGEPIS